MRSEPFKDVASVGDRPFARIWRLAVLGACAGLVIASGVIGFIHWGAGAPRTAAPRVLASVAPEHMVLQSDWNEQITRDTYWRAGRNPAPSTP